MFHYRMFVITDDVNIRNDIYINYIWNALCCPFIKSYSYICHHHNLQIITSYFDNNDDYNQQNDWPYGSTCNVSIEMVMGIIVENWLK